MGATAWGPGHAKQLERPSASRREIGGSKVGCITGPPEITRRREGDGWVRSSAEAGNARGAKGPYCSRNTLTPTWEAGCNDSDTQEACRPACRRIYAKRRAEPSWALGACTSMSASWTRSAKPTDWPKTTTVLQGVIKYAESLRQTGSRPSLQQLQDALVTRTYHPMRLRHKAIPKEGGKGTARPRFRPSTVWSREPQAHPGTHL